VLANQIVSLTKKTHTIYCN